LCPSTLILTLQLDPTSKAFFDEMRQLHYPPERNVISAHLTLFHQLPEDQKVMETLQQTAETQAPFSLACTGLFSLGRGAAYQLESSALVSLHKVLSGAFSTHLSAQDKQRFRPHVVIQNKVTSERARSLLAELQLLPLPANITACGLELWRYLGGPWEPLHLLRFSGAAQWGARD
jgi:2'-5' RNA ligase superfamily protein